MAKYDVTYSCGHEGTIQLFGPTSQREKQLEIAALRLCPECYRKKKEAERAEINKEAERKSEAEGLPELTGSEKQVAWANTLRLQKMKALDEWIEEIQSEGKLGGIIRSADGEKYKSPVAEMLAGEKFLLENMTEARFWIDNRFSMPSEILDAGISGYRRGQKEELPEEVAQEIELEKAALTVEPETAAPKGGIAEIKVGNDIKAIYEKDDDFRKIVKGLGYEWSGDAWAKKITEWTEPAIERVAELGNALLNAGFTVRFPDHESMEKAISGKFEKECLRWVRYNTEKKRLSISWKGQNDTVYKAALKIPGAKYSDRRVTVPLERYREAEDFASTLGFRFSQRAMAEIEKFKTEEASFRKAEVGKITEQISDDDKLNAQLKKAGVIEELKDDIE